MNYSGEIMISEKMNRRKFVKTTSAVLASTLVPWNFAFGSQNNPLVWEIEGSVGPTVQKLFEILGGLQTLLPKAPAKSTVLLKPNLCLPHKESMATTTSVELVDSFCEFLLANEVRKVIIADHTLQKANRFKRQEIVKLGKKYPSIKVILANDQRFYRPVQVEGKVLKETETLKLLPKVDLVINLATAKHHTASHVTLAIKNLMGLVWDRSVFHTEMDLQQAIGDLALALRPQLNVIDASRVLLNGGPTGPGPIIEENRVFASRDILALDSVVASRYNFGGKNLSPKEIPHLAAAYQNGVGEIDLQKIQLQKITA
ncbi:MAG: DUF362 domain-containing protein [Calditrichaeota bacterium]|nr:MAG: DUF362 domain-containing protein [Calditrichota bacterium]